MRHDGVTRLPIWLTGGTVAKSERYLATVNTFPLWRMNPQRFPLWLTLDSGTAASHLPIGLGTAAAGRDPGQIYCGHTTRERVPQGRE